MSIRDTRLLQARRRHRDLFLRAGAGFPAASYTLSPDIGVTQAPPIQAGENALPVTLVFSIEFFAAPSYPNGALLSTNDLLIGIFSGTTIIPAFDSPDALATIDLANPSTPGGGVPPIGTHTFAIVLDPVGGRVGAFVDGYQAGQASHVFASWATGNWVYPVTGFTGYGYLSDLEVFPSYIPPTFVA